MDIRQDECEHGYGIRNCERPEAHSPHDWGRVSGNNALHCPGKVNEEMTCSVSTPHGRHVWGHEANALGGPFLCWGIKPSGTEPTQPNPALSDVPLDVYEASRLRDGDTLLLVAEDIRTTPDHMKKTRTYLEHVLPGIRVVIVAGFRHALVHERDRVEERTED